MPGASLRRMPPKRYGARPPPSPARIAWPACANSRPSPCGAATPARPLAWRTEADQLERRTLAEYTAAPRYEPHGLGEPELRRLADTLDPLLLAATGAWLLRDAASGHHVLLVLARESWICARALTGEPSYLRRDCRALLQRLLPRVQRNIEPLLLAAGDPLPGVCTDATRLRRAGA